MKPVLKAQGLNDVIDIDRREIRSDPLSFPSDT